jgi:ubiquinone/menaquinone biosynthesis C-methylase UbiE
MTTATRFWDRAAAKYARTPIKDEAAYARTLERTCAHLTSADRVLEVGCGTGTTALTLAGHVAHVTATDISPAMIAIARDRAQDRKVANVTFAPAALSDAPPEAGPFDAVLAFNLLHLADDLPYALQALARRLEPGGLLISKTPCLGRHGWHLRVLVAALQAVGRAPYVAFLTVGRLEAAIAQAGFEILERGDYPAKPPSRFLVARKA